MATFEEVALWPFGGDDDKKESPGSFLTSAPMNFIYSLINGVQKQQALDVYNRGNEERYGQGLQIGTDVLNYGAQAYPQRRQDVLGGLDQSASNTLGAYGGVIQQLLSLFNQGAQGINQGYQDRYKTAEGDLENYALQQKEDQAAVLVR